MYTKLMRESKTEALVARHIGPITTALRHLETLLTRFGMDLAQEANPAVVFEPLFSAKDGEAISGYRELGAGSSRRHATEALLQIDYGVEDKANQSIKCYGALGVPKRLINEAIIINRAKSEFKDAMQAVARKRVRVTVKGTDGRPVSALKSLSNIILRRIQSSSVNLLAAYREIPLIEETPSSIQLTHTRTRSVPRKTASALLNLLADRDDALARADRERLEALDSNEYLVSPKERYPRMRANVFYRRQDTEGDPARQLVMAELPILYPIRQGVRPPDVTAPSIRQRPRKHPVSYIEREEFVRTLHYRRMQPGHRQHAKTK